MNSRQALVLLSLILSGLASAKGVLWDRDLPKYATKTGLLNTILAKEICSCHWIARLSVKECIERGNLPAGTEKTVNVLPPDENNHVMTVETSRFGACLYNGCKKGPAAWAMYNASHPEYGCHIIHGALEAAAGH